jgi:hypothetical protein
MAFSDTIGVSSNIWLFRPPWNDLDEREIPVAFLPDTWYNAPMAENRIPCSRCRWSEDLDESRFKCHYRTPGQTYPFCELNKNDGPRAWWWFGGCEGAATIPAHVRAWRRAV